MANWINGAESFIESNISANSGQINLNGGKYGLTASATWGGGNAVLQRLSADGSTYVPVHTQFTANGYVAVDIPPGIYRVSVTTATAVYFEIVKIPVSATDGR